MLRILRRADVTFGNFTAFSLHNHEPGNAFQTPANFAQGLAHQVSDAGANVYVGHGPHQLRGIEIYRGEPIFFRSATSR